jgi:hypothetical protein
MPKVRFKYCGLHRRCDKLLFQTKLEYVFKRSFNKVEVYGVNFETELVKKNIIQTTR